MRDVVASAVRAFNEQFEGHTTWLYLDSEGNMTTGEGDLLPSLAAAQALPWQINGAPASPQDVADAWNTVAAATGLESAGGGAYAALTSLRLTDDGVTQLVTAKSQSNEATVRSFFPGWDDFPADAQLGILSMAWAAGAGIFAEFPKFTAAANAGDWSTAAAECQLAPTPGIDARNAQDLLLFENAATPGADPSVLYWPNAAADVLSGSGSSGGGGIFSVLAGLVVLGVAGWSLYRLHKGGMVL